MFKNTVGPTLAALILSLGACGTALADDARGTASVILSNLQLTTSAVGSGANGGATSGPDDRQFGMEAIDTAGRAWGDGGTAVSNGPLNLTHSTTEHDHAIVISSWTWFSSSPLISVSDLAQAPGVQDWASAFSQQSVQTLFHLAPNTRLTLTADVDLNAELGADVPWQSASYSFYSVFAPVDGGDAQSYYRAASVAPGQAAGLTESISFSIENTGTSTMDIVWQRDASTFVGMLAVPEPAPISMALVGGGILFWVARRRAATKSER